jgi:quinol monooxygenase YgiN
MYVVFTAVEMLPGTTEDAAVDALKEQLIPQIKQAPGFIRGEWFGDDKHGHGFIVFETEDQAKQVLQEVGEVLIGVKVTRSNVYRLHAEA